jgi:large subunit ribosomal protein L6
MSRKGAKLISIPSSVIVSITTGNVNVKGPLGAIDVSYPNVIAVENVNGSVKVTRANDEKQTKMYHGTVNSNIANAVSGTFKAYEKHLVIRGVGYKAAIKGKQIELALGFSHLINLDIPTGLKVVCPDPTHIDISGISKELVGEFAAKIRSYKKPEPYNQKGIAYHDEVLIHKVGKTAEGAKK